MWLVSLHQVLGRRMERGGVGGHRQIEGTGLWECQPSKEKPLSLATAVRNQSGRFTD